MRNKKTLLILAALLAIGATGYYLYSHAKPTREYGKLSSNLQNSYVMNDSIYFYTGSFFAKYNTNNTVTRVSDYLYIASGINNVSWKPDAVLFQTNPLPQDRDDITTAASGLGSQQYSPQWWKYSFKDKQYQLLSFGNISGCKLVAQINDTELACSKEQEPGSSATDLYLYDLSSKTSKKLLSSDNPIDQLSGSDKTIYYTETRLSGKQSLKAISTKSSSSRLLYEGTGNITYAVAPNNEVLVSDALDSTEPSKTTKDDISHSEESSPVASTQKIVLINGGEAVVEKQFKSLPVTVFVGSAGQLMYSSLDGSVNAVTEDGIETLDKATKNQLETGDTLYKLNERLYLINNRNELLTSPDDINTSHRSPESFDGVKDNDDRSDSWIDDTDMNSPGGYLYSNSVPSSLQQLEIDKWLIKRGFWPSEFSFTWVVDGVDFNAPVRPNYVIIQ